ncbi:MAG TPA: hypothetical protein ENH85_03350 [Candidatus Scalindua sp.]|nr:hypothetical protein [Candidatus Scalindua sp.]
MAKQHSNELQKETVKRFKKGESASSIAKSLGLYTTSITRVLKRHGLEMRECVGENHPSWKGGKIIKTGYPATYNPNHPRRMNIPYVYNHILEMEKKIGRVPSKTEPIHHIDIDRMNYNIKNLHLCKNNSEHQKLHASLNKIISQLVKSGIIKFKNGKYYSATQ